MLGDSGHRDVVEDSIEEQRLERTLSTENDIPTDLFRIDLLIRAMWALSKSSGVDLRSWREGL